MTRVPLTWALCDTPTMSSIGVLRGARSRQITEDLNKPGSASFRIPLDDPLAFQVEAVSTCVKVSRGTNTVWSGPVWTVQDQTDDAVGWTQVGCVGWLEFLHHRILHPGQEFTMTTPSDQMIRALLGAANVNGPVIGGAASSTFIIEGSMQSNGVDLTRAFEVFTNIGDAINQLTQLENGVDVWVDPATRALNVYTLKGSVKDSAALRLAGYRTNVSSATRNIDASEMANLFWIVGASNVTGSALDNDSQNTYGLFETQVALSDVINEAILGAYANAELVAKGRPLITYDVNPSSYSEGRVPLTYEDFELGDSFLFSVDRGRFKVTNQLARCFGFTLQDGDDGNERITSLKLVAT